MSGFKLDKNALRKMEKEIQKNIEKKVAPKVKRDQVDPLRDDLNRLAQNPPTDPEETRREVLAAYAKHGLEPGADTQTIIDAVQAGEQIRDIGIRVERPRLS